MKQNRAGSACACLLSAIALLLAAAGSEAETIKVSASADAGTMDPHSQAVTNTDQIMRQIYEGLIARDANLKLVPALATEWKLVDPKRWRFRLRPAVKFHDGKPLTPDDVAFSLLRASRPGSNIKLFSDSIERVVTVDGYSVDVITREPDPILPEKLFRIGIMSKAWAEANNAVDPTPQGKDGFATTHTNGTGPYRLVDRRPGVRTTLAAFDGWWGQRSGNVTEYISIPITSAATRVAALLSGEVDILLDPPLQDIKRIESSGRTKVLTGPENRTLLFVLDSSRDELLYSDVKGKNPFKDVRVRKALYQALDVNAITTKILRGYAIPAGLQMPPMVTGYTKELDTRAPYNPAAAKALLAQAGYPQGFGFTVDCTNNRYANDEAVCQAVVAMWAAIGIRANLNSMPLQTFFPKVSAKDSSAFLLGIGSPTLDAFYSIQNNLLSSASSQVDGIWSLGYSNPKIDELAKSAKFALDPAKRLALMQQALAAGKQDFANIPLYHSTGAWAMAKGINTVYRPDAIMEARYVTVSRK